MFANLFAWFCKQGEQSPKPAARRTRPEVENLEERQVLSVTYHGGALLSNPNVQGIYYGRDWMRGAGRTECAYLEGYLGTIVRSSYMDALTNEGYGVGQGTWNPGKIIPPTSNRRGIEVLTDGKIQKTLANLIRKGQVTAPDPNKLYIIYVDRHTVVQAGGENSVDDFRGYHSNFFAKDRYGRYADVRYAVVSTPIGNSATGLTEFQQITDTTSHELAEAATDPDPYNAPGWYDAARGVTSGEVADITNGDDVYLNGYVVQRVANQKGQPLTPAGSLRFGTAPGGSTTGAL